MARRYLSESDAREAYNTYLDESFEPVRVADLTFSVSRILEELDPTAWREGFLAWLDSEGLTTDQTEATDWTQES
jgi:hypothetical protein